MGNVIKFLDRKEITNADVIAGIVVCFLAGLCWGYLIWGLKIPFL